jgi:two-component system nitrogen regulation sensor histidine kinase NtrY
MGFKNYKYNLGARLAILVLSVFIFANLVSGNSNDLTKFLVASLIAFEVYGLYHFVNKTNTEVRGFLNSIKYDDFSHTYSTHSTGSPADDIYEDFNQVIKKFREIRAEKEAQYHYLKTIVQHVGIGIITFNKEGEIQIFNRAARELLQINQVKNLNQLKLVSEPLVEAIKKLKTGGRDLVKIARKGDDVQLAIYTIELTMREQEFKLVSIQNIQSELEEKEMEAWQNLIRVLTHEIMNSVTPISSLAATVEDELEAQLNNDQAVNHITNEEIEDIHLAVKTIQRRSDGLIKFVSDFRNLTHIPTPRLVKVNVKDLLKQILMLMKFEMAKASIKLDFELENDDLTLHVDKDQIEQVLINLIKNALQALAEDDNESKGEKLLEVKAYESEKGGIHIKIADNGSGIEEDALKKIFIPFFTTKKGGSGIGLSLSKQIMRKHYGSIAVESTMDVGTTFTLRFSAE